ncbi:MAG TPA: EthD domain-containing protein, partial [Acidimicrobiales bacterium]|nr:EthD domain-containing protein [Acidimicrobiales bacterium]
GREAKAALAKSTVADATYRVAARVPSSGATPPPPYDLILERGLANGVKLGGFSAVIEVSCPAPHGLDELARCVEGVGERLGSLIDRERSSAVAGTDLVILDGGGPVQLFYCMRRAGDTTHEAFCDFWAKQHTKIATTTPGLTGYRQLHANLGQSRVAAEAAGLPLSEIDGVALEWFRAMDGFVSAVGGPAEYTSAAKASEEQFNNLGGATSIVGTVFERSNGRGGSPW